MSFSSWHSVDKLFFFSTKIITYCTFNNTHTFSFFLEHREDLTWLLCHCQRTSQVSWHNLFTQITCRLLSFALHLRKVIFLKYRERLLTNKPQSMDTLITKAYHRFFHWFPTSRANFVFKLISETYEKQFAEIQAPNQSPIYFLI